MVIDFSAAESACDIDGAALRYLVGGAVDPAPLSPETFDRMQRFLRLRLKTGWSIWELDRVLTGLFATQLTLKTITQAAVIKRAADTLARDVLEVSSWWADMDTGLDATRPDYRSFYESVFVNPAVINPPDAAFLLDETDRSRLAVESGGGALISEHLASIAAALQVTESEAGLLAGMLTDGAGAADDALTLRNLSRLHRMASLCRAVDVDVEDYPVIERLIGPDVWNADRPQALPGFLDAIESIRASAFPVSALGYLLLHDDAGVAGVQMPAAAATDLLSAVQGAVRAVWVRYEAGTAPLIDQLGSRLGDWFSQEEIDLIIPLVGQTAPRSAEETAYLQEALDFLSAPALADAVDQGMVADVRYRRLLALLDEYGRSVASITVVSQMIAEAFALDLSSAQLILTDVVTGGDSSGSVVIAALLDPMFIDSGKEKLAAAIDAEYRQEAFGIIDMTTSLTEAEIAAFIDLHFDFLDPEEARATLVGGDAVTDVPARYRYVTAPLDDAVHLLTEEVFPEQFDAVWRVQKTALLVGGFQIGPTELPWLNDYAVRLNVLPPAGFPFEPLRENQAGFAAWKRLAEMLSLRRWFANSDADLFSLLEKAARPGLIDTTTPNPDIDALVAGGQWGEADRPLLSWWHELATSAGWPFSEVVYVAGPDLLKASLEDMLNVSALAYIARVIALARRLGTTAAQLAAWSARDVAEGDAANAKQTARARYALAQWYEIAPTLRDGLRERQRDALTACMLHRGGFGTTVDLYNFYLIDAEMSACMLTSRLKLALSSVQLFLQRCLLNLEDAFVAVAQPEEWEWRKNYRVWEANRKVFLYPENYIKPELRITRSEIFDAAQGILLQNEVTDDVAEQSLLRYLEGLDEISNLEVVGSYHEAGVSERLHVIGRTRGIPHRYFYRVRDDKSWRPWETVDADIGADQVLPVAVNQRFYIMWPVFFEKQIAGVDVLSNATMKAAKDAKIEEEISYDEYLDYLLHYDWTEENGAIFDWGYDSLQAYADTMSVYDIDDVIGWVTAMGAETWEEFSDMAKLDGKFEETFTYFEIKLAVSEYKNGKWMPSRTSEGCFESDQKNSAVALLDENQIPATQDDLQFNTTIEDDVVTVECVQLLHFTDGTIREYLAGRFEYNVLSREILSFDYKDKTYPRPWIEAPAGTIVAGNSFIENETREFEIPLVEGGWWETTHLTLLERTPGTFRVPFQHQYEHFTAEDPFFFGDDKRSFTVSSQIAMAGIAQAPIGIEDFPYVDIYIKSDIPAFGVFDAVIGASTGTFTRTSIGSPLPADAFDLTQTTGVAQYYSFLRREYRFDAFYHPLVGDLIIKVNGDGTRAALSRETQMISERFFISAYQPTDAVAEDYPVRHFSFSDIDANGFYNYEFFFHLPLLIAMRLSKNQQFAEAQQWFHTIFDPTSRSGEKGAQRFWQFKPFFDMYANASGHPFDSIYDMLTALAADPATADAETLALKEQTEQQILVWRTNPFDPHAIAALRPVAYMKAVVREYLNNLIAWGDDLFAQFTHESINEATLYYILAYQILGERPVALPELDVAARSYNELGRVDAFSNAMTEIENLINMPRTSGAGTAPVPPLYFCIPDNPHLLQLWDTVEDRLFKIRHCMTIEGVVQQLPLFQPPIPPELLVQARAAGVSIGAALAGLAVPAPHYRFAYLMQKAVEYCGVVKALGSQLLAAYEKQDAEGLTLLRAEHEESLLKASTELRNLQVDEARENLAAMEKAKVLLTARIDYYSNLEKRSEKEKAATKSLDSAELKRMKSSDQEMTASRLSLIPNFSISSGVPPSFGISFGGSNLGASFSADAAKSRGESAWRTYGANKLGTDAGYDRRWDDWKLQERLAKHELGQVEKQILAAKVRLALAEKERATHVVQLAQSREVADFLTGKFTGRELYGWMVSQTAAIYFQSYKLAYELAKRCEKAYQRETADYGAAYIAYGYFDSLKKGLLSGERLHHDLQRMEFDYLNNNRREYEITKHVSLALLDPVALFKLQTEGACEFSVPEALYDIDHPGHYLRRIRSVAVSIPCVTGPYTSVPARLTLVSSRTRIDPGASGDYAFDAGGEDGRFLISTGAGQSIAVSVGSDDAGLFTADHRDERYLPFEGSGAISDWNLTLTSAVPTFNWATITDVVLHVRYTAREGGELLRGAALASLTDALAAVPLRRAFSARHEFPSEWNAFLRPTAGAADAELNLDLASNRFPYFTRHADPAIVDIMLVAVVKDPADWTETTFMMTTGSRTDDVTPVSSGELYAGRPTAMVSYAGGVPPGVWKITVPLSGLGELSTVFDDLVLIVTYELRLPV